MLILIFFRVFHIGLYYSVFVFAINKFCAINNVIINYIEKYIFYSFCFELMMLILIHENIAIKTKKFKTFFPYRSLKLQFLTSIIHFLYFMCFISLQYLIKIY